MKGSWKENFHLNEYRKVKALYTGALPRSFPICLPTIVTRDEMESCNKYMYAETVKGEIRHYLADGGNVWYEDRKGKMYGREAYMPDCAFVLNYVKGGVSVVQDATTLDLNGRRAIFPLRQFLMKRIVVLLKCYIECRIQQYWGSLRLPEIIASTKEGVMAKPIASLYPNSISTSVIYYHKSVPEEDEEEDDESYDSDVIGKLRYQLISVDRTWCEGELNLRPHMSMKVLKLQTSLEYLTRVKSQHLPELAIQPLQLDVACSEQKHVSCDFVTDEVFRSTVRDFQSNIPFCNLNTIQKVRRLEATVSCYAYKCEYESGCRFAVMKRMVSYWGILDPGDLGFLFENEEEVDRILLKLNDNYLFSEYWKNWEFMSFVIQASRARKVLQKVYETEGPPLAPPCHMVYAGYGGALY